jgi:uncharacterized coiled-coil protein SlyX
MAPTGTVDNTAIGSNALSNNTEGNDNIALGRDAGSAITVESNNIDIGNTGVINDAGVIRIGDTHGATFIAGIFGSPLIPASGAHPVYVDASGQLFADQTVTASVTSDEFQMLRRTVEDQKATIEQQRAEFEIKVTQQQKSLETLTAQLKAQNDQLQRVTVRMEQNRARSTKVANAK